MRDGLDALLLDFTDSTGKIAAVVGGYRRQLIEAGIGQEAAEQMTIDFHAHWVAMVLGRAQPDGC